MNNINENQLKEVNAPIGLKNAMAISKLLNLPNKDKVTILDWNMRNFEFLEEAFPHESRLMYRATLNNRLESIAKRDESTVKVYRSSTAAESKISKNAFSFAIIDENIRESLYVRAVNIDKVGIPNFEKEVEDQILKEQQKISQLQSEMSEQFDFNKVKADDSMKDVPKQNEEKKIADLIKKRKKIWRDQKVKAASDIRIFRDDYNTLQRTTKALKSNGVLVFVTMAALLDSEVSSKLANFYDDIRIYRNESLDMQGKVIVMGRKLSQRKNRNNLMVEVIEEARYTKLNDFIQFPLKQLTDEQLNDLSIDNPVAYRQAIVDKLKKQTYHYLNVDGTSNGRPYDLPKGKESDVKVFRVGPVTTEELREALNSSKTVNKKVEKTIDMITQQATNITPTPLHEGHIVMLLTSGILNGYIGKGINQHLVKGTARKEVRVENKINEDGTIETLEKDYYNISVKTLNSDGEFKEIM